MAAFGIGMAVHYGIEIRLHSMRKKLTLAGTAVVSVVGLLICWPRVIVRVLRVLFPNVIWELHTSEQVVAITFDDGPDPNFTPKVLEVMRKYNIQATFFLVGERARRFPQLVEQIRKEGHFVANHSDSWRRTIQLDGNEFERDLLRAEHSTCPSSFARLEAESEPTRFSYFGSISIPLSLAPLMHLTHIAPRNRLFSGR
jgi:hypothetical protein